MKRRRKRRKEGRSTSAWKPCISSIFLCCPSCHQPHPPPIPLLYQVNVFASNSCFLHQPSPTAPCPLLVSSHLSYLHLATTRKKAGPFQNYHFQIVGRTKVKELRAQGRQTLLSSSHTRLDRCQLLWLFQEGFVCHTGLWFILPTSWWYLKGMFPFLKHSVQAEGCWQGIGSSVVITWGACPDESPSVDVYPPHPKLLFIPIGCFAL